MGLSFAIPIELAINVADQLREHGRVSRGYLGVLIQDVDHNLAESFGMAQPYGALVSRVMPDSPAAKAKLQVGDVILAFNDQRLLNSSQLPPLVGASRIEEQATLKILRDGKEIVIPVQVGRLADDDEEPELLPAKVEPDQIEQLGLTVIDIDPQVRKELGVEESGGALVGKVNPGAAQDAGIRRGDIVLMFDGIDVSSAKHLRELIDKAEDKRTVAVLVKRGENPLFMALRLKD
jgi:serine protease Do